MSLLKQSVQIQRTPKGAKTGAGYQTPAPADVPGSPFTGYPYRTAFKTIDDRQAQDGFATLDPHEHVALRLSDNGGSLPAFQDEDVVILTDGTRQRVIRVRKYDDRIVLDVETGNV